MFRKLWIWICCTGWIRRLCKALHIKLPVVILAVGDSLTYGTGASKDKSYPAMLERLLTGALVINEGVPGVDSRFVYSMISTWLEWYKPHLVLICIGTNDMNGGVSDEWLKYFVKASCEKVKKYGTKQVLIAVPDWRQGIPLQEAADLHVYREVGVELGMPVLPKVLGTVLSNPNLRSDDIHANAAGYRMLACGIAQFLKERRVLND